MAAHGADVDGLTLHSVAQGVVRGYVLAAADRSLVGQHGPVFGTADAARASVEDAIARRRIVVLELREVEAR